MTRYWTVALFLLAFTAGAFVASRTRKLPAVTDASPPASIVICGIKDHPCVTYRVSFHQSTSSYGDGAGEGFTDYQAKTISIASSNDRFKNVQALEHEVYHAALWERGFKDTENWDLHAWIYFSEGPFSLVLHDNPDFVRYIMNAY
jgi:poly(3-hydroxybutyrate) depolymerase